MVSISAVALRAINVTILLGTDRFTQVRQETLNQGDNKWVIATSYAVDPSWYEPGGLYWSHFSSVRFVMLADDEIVANTLLTTYPLSEINEILFAVVLVIVGLFLLQVRRSSLA
jgi:hypothetical protein